MNAEFILRSGKYKGKSYRWVETYQPWYIRWVLENRPEMLREHNKPNVNKSNTNKEDDTEDEETISEREWKRSKLMVPNLSFFNENGTNTNKE